MISMSMNMSKSSALLFRNACIRFDGGPSLSYVLRLSQGKGLALNDLGLFQRIRMPPCRKSSRILKIGSSTASKEWKRAMCGAVLASSINIVCRK